jgi:hypothetical protein
MILPPREPDLRSASRSFPGRVSDSGLSASCRTLTRRNLAPPVAQANGSVFKYRRTYNLVVTTQRVPGT